MESDAMKFICPSCERPVYNRRITKCEFCSETLPSELLFSQNEINDLDKQQTESLRSQNNTSNNSFNVSSNFLSTDFDDTSNYE